ncbi:MAG: hypothetical protein NUW01_00090 [Gemmatimonadaceae bacterium]|nr:hypothetical protein [Gemmatimonadaceae bacterium]
MSLSDDIAKAEQRARDAVLVGIIGYVDVLDDDDSTSQEAYQRIHTALTRYAAVCRLAGRWEEHIGAVYEAFSQERADQHEAGCGFAPDVRADLARLMEGCP